MPDNGMTLKPGKLKHRCLGVPLFYASILAGGIGLLLLINSYGETLSVAAPKSANAQLEPTAPKIDALLHVLIVLAAVILLGRLVGRFFIWVGQPQVMGEIVAGILLGPSLLGQLAPEAPARLLPPSAVPLLGIIAQLGVILYMFLVGLELNTSMLRTKAHATVAISHAGIVVPFVLGNLLAVILYPKLCSDNVTFTSFGLFLGIAMSITAFPVLARILTDRKMNQTRLGSVALTCAATDDATAWCLLALVVGFVQARLGSGFLVAGLTIGYVGIMLFAVRPWLRRLATLEQENKLSQETIALIFVALLLSALMTEFIGIHALFGAFLLGALIPHDSGLARTLGRRMEDLVTVFLLPAFFAFTGMRTEIGLISGLENWLLCGAIILVATAGKFGGTLLAARLTGSGWTQAAALGILMNTRGLMELIVLNIGLELGVISPTLFAMMVIMALVTTFATTPLLNLLAHRLPEEFQPAAITVQSNAVARVGSRSYENAG
jgi:Kef-type K+ transport system membrane component KefB